jgi:hypothetical protein
MALIWPHLAPSGLDMPNSALIPMMIQHNT